MLEERSCLVFKHLLLKRMVRVMPKPSYNTIRQIRTMCETDVVGKSVKELSKEG